MLHRTVVLGAVVATVCAWAQESRGSLSGTVTDSSGAVITNVALKLQSVESGVAFTGATNSAGQYRFPLLNPGTYRLTAEAPGFRKFERGDILLHVNQSATIDIPMQVGAQSEVVVVTGQSPLLDTEKSDRGLVVDRRRIIDLPLNNRTPIMLSALSPGVLHSASQQHLVPYANSGLGREAMLLPLN